jgi:hypothetical protein
VVGNFRKPRLVKVKDMLRNIYAMLNYEMRFKVLLGILGSLGQVVPLLIGFPFFVPRKLINHFPYDKVDVLLQKFVSLLHL